MDRLLAAADDLELIVESPPQPLPELLGAEETPAQDSTTSTEGMAPLEGSDRELLRGGPLPGASLDISAATTAWVVDVPGLSLALKNFTNGRRPYGLVKMVSVDARIGNNLPLMLSHVPKMLRHVYIGVGGVP